MGYDLLKFAHILSAICWVGGGVAVQVLGTRAFKATDPNEAKRLTEAAAWASNRFFVPASFITLIFGALAVWTSDVWGFGDSWVIVGLVGYALSAGIGMAYLGPTAEKAVKLFEANGPTDPEARKAGNSLIAVARLDLVIMAVVVFDMVIKPGA